MMEKRMVEKEIRKPRTLLDFLGVEEE